MQGMKSQLIPLPYCGDNFYSPWSRQASSILRHRSAFDYLPNGMMHRTKFIEMMNDRLGTNLSYQAVMARIIMGSNKQRFHVRSAAGFPVFKDDDDSFYRVEDWEDARLGNSPSSYMRSERSTATR